MKYQLLEDMNDGQYAMLTEQIFIGRPQLMLDTYDNPKIEPLSRREKYKLRSRDYAD